MRVYTDDFFIRFEEGIRRYLIGRWIEARDWLIEALVHKPSDGPSLVLLNFMESYDYKAPDNWTGVRTIKLV